MILPHTHVIRNVSMTPEHFLKHHVVRIFRWASLFGHTHVFSNVSRTSVLKRRLRCWLAVEHQIPILYSPLSMPHRLLLLKKIKNGSKLSVSSILNPSLSVSKTTGTPRHAFRKKKREGVSSWQGRSGTHIAIRGTSEEDPEPGKDQPGVDSSGAEGAIGKGRAGDRSPQEAGGSWLHIWGAPQSHVYVRTCSVHCSPDGHDMIPNHLRCCPLPFQFPPFVFSPGLINERGNNLRKGGDTLCVFVSKRVP